jgi:hypothetical protein
MTEALNIAIAVVFTAWAALSGLSQLRPAWLQRLKSRDLLHLIPNWRFFAPNPARRDYHLEYRTLRAGGAPGRWQRVPTIARRSIISIVWHPAKRRRKAFNTLIRRVMRAASEWGQHRAGRSIAYLTVLNHVQRTAGVCEPVQFRIVTAQDFCAARPVRLAFTSDWHAPPPAGTLEAVP